uniref:Uncharacterized protein n=1 Tax=Chromera velia CCMP2878 TaxID=1169474 RepID=A0A0G4IF24_9ALVE|eukprot:Cvel_2444.t1-p1 / transcript=Cvel_2444.t1 / gene=Cvel_2444 / organism=Chromera_velia_CCMP2878 / gene_product=hypothetical protein / transcript_product=hypothetical protein / location=Cvel_scaffold96:5456-8221(+) / protein_length=922 / sequence_SO=supercontig / SO=protein_coding / is_pseudo=false
MVTGQLSDTNFLGAYWLEFLDLDAILSILRTFKVSWGNLTEDGGEATPLLRQLEAVLSYLPIEEQALGMHVLVHTHPPLCALPFDDVPGLEEHPPHFKVIPLPRLWQLCRQKNIQVHKILRSVKALDSFFAERLAPLEVRWLLERLEECDDERTFQGILLILSIIDPLLLLPTELRVFPPENPYLLYLSHTFTLNSLAPRVAEGGRAQEGPGSAGPYSLAQLAALNDNNACVRALIWWWTQIKGKGHQTFTDQMLCNSGNEYLYVESACSIAIRLESARFLKGFLSRGISPIASLPDSSSNSSSNNNSTWRGDSAFQRVWSHECAESLRTLFADWLEEKAEGDVGNAFLKPLGGLPNGLSVLHLACKGWGPEALRFVLNRVRSRVSPETLKKGLMLSTKEHSQPSVLHLSMNSHYRQGSRNEVFEELCNVCEDAGVNLHSLKDFRQCSVFQAYHHSIDDLTRMRPLDPIKDVELVGCRPSLFEFFFPKDEEIPHTVPSSKGPISPFFIVALGKVPEEAQAVPDPPPQADQSTHQTQPPHEFCRDRVWAWSVLLERGADPSSSHKETGPWLLWVLQRLLTLWAGPGSGFGVNPRQVQVTKLLESVRDTIDPNRPVRCPLTEGGKKGGGEEGDVGQESSVTLVQSALCHWVRSLRAASSKGDQLGECEAWERMFAFLFQKGGVVYSKDSRISHSLLNPHTLTHPQATKFFLDRGADPLVVDKDGRNALAHTLQADGGGGSDSVLAAECCDVLLKHAQARGEGQNEKSDPQNALSALESLWTAKDAAGRCALDFLPFVFSSRPASGDERWVNAVASVLESVLGSEIELSKDFALVVKESPFWEELEKLPIRRAFQIRNRVVSIIEDATKTLRSAAAAAAAGEQKVSGGTAQRNGGALQRQGSTSDQSESVEYESDFQYEEEEEED